MWDSTISLVGIGLGLLLLGVLAGLMLKGYGIARIGWLNLSRLQRLRRRFERTTDTAEKNALEAVVKRCDTLRARWVLDESELKVGDHTLALMEAVAAPFHPQSAKPLQEARLGRLLNAFLDVRNQAEALSRMKGVRPLTRFRLRHLRFFLRAWKRKTQFDESQVGRAARKFRLFFITRWAYALVRLMDLTFWSAKMMFYFVYDIVFRVLLVRWYLTVGELAINVYRDRDPHHEAPDEEVLEDLDELPDPEPVADTTLPEGVKELVRASRKQILLHTRPLNWNEARERYRSLVQGIARHHHPESEEPLYEARPYDMMVALSRFAEQVVQLQNQPVLNKLLDLRLSHLLMMKDTTDWILENQIFNFVRKYKVGTAVKYSTLLYKAFKKGNPGVLFRDFAFVLAREGLKRWLVVYLHGKVALQANFIYSEKKTATEPPPAPETETEKAGQETSSR
jgi:hypothetical protein